MYFTRIEEPLFAIDARLFPCTQPFISAGWACTTHVKWHGLIWVWPGMIPVGVWGSLIRHWETCSRRALSTSGQVLHILQDIHWKIQFCYSRTRQPIFYFSATALVWICWRGAMRGSAVFWCSILGHCGWIPIIKCYPSPSWVGSLCGCRSWSLQWRCGTRRLRNPRKWTPQLVLQTDTWDRHWL